MNTNQFSPTSALQGIVETEDVYKDDVEELDQEVATSPESPAYLGSESVSGSAPDVESDDNMLDNAHQMGIALDADSDNPKPLNIAQDVEDAEKYRETH